MSNYKRLTTTMVVNGKNIRTVKGKVTIYDLIDRLCDLEDKIENGTLVELPCKVGDTVYCVEYFCNYKGCSSDEQIFCCGCPEMIERERRKEKFVISKKKFRLQDLDRVGKTLFPTEEAAEARLKELQEKQK